jgi:hypothetical protein
MSEHMGEIYNQLLPQYEASYEQMMATVSDLDLMDPRSILDLQIMSGLVTKPLEIGSNLISKFAETSSRIINNYN